MVLKNCSLRTWMPLWDWSTHWIRVHMSKLRSNVKNKKSKNNDDLRQIGDLFIKVYWVLSPSSHSVNKLSCFFPVVRTSRQLLFVFGTGRFFCSKWPSSSTFHSKKRASSLKRREKYSVVGKKVLSDPVIAHLEEKNSTVRSKNLARLSQYGRFWRFSE